MKIVSLRRAITGAAFVLLSLGLSAHADTLDDIRKAGKIRIAILAMPPFGMTDDKMQPTGSEGDLAQKAKGAQLVRYENLAAICKQYHGVDIPTQELLSKAGS